MDEIILRGMWFYAYHGVFGEETAMGQRFGVHLRLTVDLRLAGQSDDVQDTVNYAELYSVVKSVVEDKPYKLIERVAAKIASQILLGFERVQQVEVQVDKPSAPIAGIVDMVSVKIVRNRESL